MANVATEAGKAAPVLPDVDGASLDAAIGRTRDYLLETQHADGYWVGELYADASVPAGYIPLTYLLEGKVDAARQRRVVTFVRSQQQSDGSWGTFKGGRGDLNVSIQVYFALKLAGVPAGDPLMLKARDFILSAGGITRSNALTKMWLAIFGQYDWKGTPSLPPEIVFLPNWFYINIYEFASWSRETILALMLILARKPVFKVPDSAGVQELFVEPPGKRVVPPGRADKLFSLKKFFVVADGLFKAYDRVPWKPLRGAALRKTEKWVVDHQEPDGSWGGIMLPWVYSLIALKDLGYPLDHPVMAKSLAGLEGFIREDAESLRLEPATSPVWDTAWVLMALSEAGLDSGDPAIAKAARWLLGQEIRVAGDWKVKNRNTEPGGWAFEFENDFYPDIDDTSVVPRALLRVCLEGAEESRKADAVERASRWVMSMQNRDGGFAAFDRDNTRRILAHIPFADFMTPLDPASPDVTAHAIEFLGETKAGADVVRKALGYLKRRQEPDGAWYGRWGVNYVYGTGLVLQGLRAAGEDMNQDWIQRSVAWLEKHQNADGGWGETCASYSEPSLRGTGPSTASQTAWAVAGLLAAGRARGSSVRKGVEYLLLNQRPDGTWREEESTGTGFPGTFYLHYDMYRIYFPLMALARYRTSLKEESK